jgi:hypothetical protein
VWTDGCRSRPSGWQAAGDDGEACDIVGWVGGGWSTSVDDELTEEEAVAEGTCASGAAAGSSSLN